MPSEPSEFFLEKNMNVICLGKTLEQYKTSGGHGVETRVRECGKLAHFEHLFKLGYLKGCF